MDTQLDTFIEAGLQLPREKFLIALDCFIKALDERKWNIDTDVKKRLSDCWDPIPQRNLADRIQLPFTATQAKRLQEISGLDIEDLAEIFAISLETYSRWLAGSSLPDESREQLGKVLVLMEEASERLKTPEAMKDWLKTPVEENSPSPLDYLVQREYGLFHAFILHVPTGREVFQPPLPRSRDLVNPFMTPEQFEEKLAQHRPPVYLDDEDYDIDESRVDLTKPIPLGGFY